MAVRRYVRVQAEGQIALPAEVRRRLGLEQGDVVLIEESGDGGTITPVRAPGSRLPERLGRTLAEQGVSWSDLAVPEGEYRSQTGAPLRTYIAEELAGFVSDDRLSEPEKVIAARFISDEPALDR